jgi:cytidylate kinase
MSSLPHSVVAVDGTAASGKSTFSRALAAKLGYSYVNTGSMYRGVTWYLQQRSLPLGDTAAVERVIESVPIESGLHNGELSFRIAGLDPLPYVRDASINQGVSLVAQVATVRRILVAQQQGLALIAPVVMEGRDIGTVVFPQTPYKFYLDADPEVRAQRRAAQGEADAIQKRDGIDSQRKHSPLSCAADAQRLDSGRHSVDELLVQALDHLATLGFKPGA